MKVEGLKSLEAKLRKRKDEAAKDIEASVTVGYTQSYAIYVHEIDKNYRGGKEYKYLEKPARNLQGEIARIIREVYAKTGSLIQGLLVGGLRLQRESQAIVPVDTSALRASAFTCETKDEDRVAEEAYARSEALRVSTKDQRKKAKLAAKAKKKKKKKKKKK